jgi:purine catabolism regulator
VELEQGFSLGELVFAYYAYIWQEAEKSRERKEEL